MGNECEELWSQASWYTTVILVLGAKARRWREFKVNLGYLEKGRKSTLLSSHPQDSTHPVMNRRNSDLPEQPHPSLLFHTKINEGSRVWGCSSVARMSPWHYKVLGLHSQYCTNWMWWWHLRLASRLKGVGKEERAFKVILKDTVSYRPP